MFVRRALKMLWLSPFLLFFAFATCSEVLELTKDNFHSQLKSIPVCLVKFYAPWCGHCKSLAPEYKSAADIISKKTANLKLAEVDCTAHGDICSEFGVNGYPTLKIFRDGIFDSEYNGPRNADGIANYMISRAGPVSKEISAFKDVEDSLSDDKPSVVAFIKSSSDPLMKTFMTLAKSMIDNAVFLHSHNNIYENSGENELRLYLPKRLRTKLEPDFSIYSGEMEVDDIKKWIRKDGHGLVGYRSPDDSFYFVDSNLVVIYNNESINTYPSGVKYLRNRILKTLKNHPDKFKDLKFAYSFTGDFSYELSDYEINADQLPAVRISSKDGKKYRLDKYSPESFLEFLNKFQNGLLTPHLKSEPIPTSDSSVVKKLVALNFNDIVNDVEKDVMVVFHAPWCGHCKNLMPKYEEAASKLKNEPNLVLAAMDATANDVPPPYEVTGFPTIYFVPKGKKSSPMLYQGGRDTSDIIKFLAREATEELSGYDRSGNTKKSDL
uniref:Protein disulfide-isomerase n=1 Tax=Schistosoma japonicum TaxID=6182 RepID=C1LNQ6_SCHJA|nr:putative protein disulfide isomerase-associated 3 precursor [Schistosoma japonicum]